MRKDTLYLTLSRDITSYTITSGQRAIATNVNYAVTIESPTLTTNLAGRDVSLIISDTEGNTLTTATTFYPDTKNPYKAVTGSLLLDGGVYGKFFDGKPVDTAVRLPIVIRDKSATLLSSDIVVVNGGDVAEPSASDEVVAGLVNAIRFYDLAEFKAWLDGMKERPDGLKPTDIVVGQWVHTQQDGSFICKELIGSEPSVTKNFTTIVTQFPLTGTLKMNPDNGVGLSVYSGDVYNDADATSFSVDAITYKGDAFTFTAGDNQIARQKDNYALENRVNSMMTATLNAVKADNANTYQAMLPVMNTTVEARDRAETAAQGAKSSETRAVEAETRAATSEANALAYKDSASASEENAGLYRQQALASAQKAEQEVAKATTKASEAASSASKAAASANEALYYKNSAETFSDSAESWSHSASEYAAAADTSADLAKMSEDHAAISEANAATSAANAASSESNALSYKETAVASADLSTTNKNSAADFSASASASASAAASSATAAANSATAAAKSATDLADAVATAESLDGRLSAIEPSALRAKDVVISNKNNTYADGAFSYNPAIETFYNTGTIETGAYFLAYCTGLKWVYASHWDKIGSNAFRECTSLTEVKGSVWRVANMMNDDSAIGAYAFANCKNLEKMPPVSNDIKTLESGHWAGVRIIGYRAFYNCRKLPAQFVKDIISSPALWSINNDAFRYCCLDSGGIDELVLGKNIVFNSWGAFAKSGVKRVDCSQMVKDPIFNNQFMGSRLEELILPQRQFSYYNGFSDLAYLRYVKMPPEEPVVLYGNHLFYKDNSFSSVDEVTVEFPITRAEAEAWAKYQFIVLDSFPLEKTVFNFTDEQGVTYNA